MQLDAQYPVTSEGRDSLFELVALGSRDTLADHESPHDGPADPQLLEVPVTRFARLLADRMLIERDLTRPVRGRVRAVPQVWADIDHLMAGAARVSPQWDLSQNEADRVGDDAYALIDSLAEDPLQGDPIEASDDARFLGLCRRLVFDPSDHPPLAPDGEPWPRLCLYWSNLANSSDASIRALAVFHRLDQSLVSRQPSGLPPRMDKPHEIKENP